MFRRQILGRRDSFGKIYAVTQQLDMLQPQEIYRKTVQIMEDVLENHSLTIYRMEKNHGFARLTAASAGMTPEPAHSLEVEQWLDVIRAIEQEGLWVNRGFLPGHPMYAAGVRQNGSLVVLICLYTANEEQMTLYYQNLFRILCGLVETALCALLSTRAPCGKTGICPAPACCVRLCLRSSWLQPVPCRKKKWRTICCCG